jgi:hypothetical protein
MPGANLPAPTSEAERRLTPLVHEDVLAGVAVQRLRPGAGSTRAVVASAAEGMTCPHPMRLHPPTCMLRSARACALLELARLTYAGGGCCCVLSVASAPPPPPSPAGAAPGCPTHHRVAAPCRCRDTAAGTVAATTLPHQAHPALPRRRGRAGRSRPPRAAWRAPSTGGSRRCGSCCRRTSSSTRCPPHPAAGADTGGRWKSSLPAAATLPPLPRAMQHEPSPLALGLPLTRSSKQMLQSPSSRCCTSRDAPACTGSGVGLAAAAVVQLARQPSGTPERGTTHRPPGARALRTCAARQRLVALQHLLPSGDAPQAAARAAAGRVDAGQDVGHLGPMGGHRRGAGHEQCWPTHAGHLRQ